MTRFSRTGADFVCGVFAAVAAAAAILVCAAGLSGFAARSALLDDRAESYRAELDRLKGIIYGYDEKTGSVGRVSVVDGLLYVDDVEIEVSENFTFLAERGLIWCYDNGKTAFVAAVHTTEFGDN